MINIYSILSGIDPRLTWPGILVVMLMAVMAAVLRFVPAGFGAHWIRPATRWAAVALGLLAVAQIGLAISYFFYPRYMDWIEPTIVAASWIGWQGGYFYPSLTGGDITGVWYGPVLFHVTGFMLWLFGPSIETSKLLGVAAFLAAQIISFKVLIRVGASRAEAAVVTFIQCLLQSGFANQASAFGVRADPLLLLLAECGVWVAISAPSFRNAALLGGLIGLSANLKIHGIFFIFPIFAFFISQAGNNVRRAQLFAVGTAAGLACLLLPFLPEAAAPDRYLRLFGMDKHFGISRWILQKNIVYVVMLWSPVALLYAVFRPKLPPGLVWFGVACVPAMGLVTVAASIEGGGSYNYLPFLPSMAWLIVNLMQVIRRQLSGEPGRQRFRQASLAAMLAFLFGFTPDLAIAWYPIMTQYKQTPMLWRVRAEVDAEMAKHPDRLLEVGPGRYADLRVIPVFRGHPLAIDSETWNDLRMGGIDEDIVRRLIRTCRMDTWLLPATGPVFHEPIEPKLYSPESVAEFRAHYRRDPSGGMLDAWRCVRKD